MILQMNWHAQVCISAFTINNNRPIQYRRRRTHYPIVSFFPECFLYPQLRAFRRIAPGTRNYVPASWRGKAAGQPRRSIHRVIYRHHACLQHRG